MPEATAQLKTPLAEKPVIVEDRLDGIREKVGKSAEEAMNEPHDPVPIGEQSPHVPEGITTNTTLQNIPKVSGSYGEAKTPFSGLSTLSEHLDYADQLVTGRDHVIDAAHRFTTQKAEKEAKGVEANRPEEDSKGPIGKFFAWLHDEAA